jgi:uncharacterized membrane protein YdjX (TVP38/TMEM64 family)
MNGKKKERWINIILVLCVLAVLGVTARVYFSRCDRFDCPGVQAFVESFGVWAPVVYGALYIISSPVPFLAPTLSTAAGVLFGSVRGTIYVVIVATVSSLVPFFLARRLGRGWVQSKLENRKVGEIYDQSEGRKGFFFVLLMRLIPLLPFEVQNYIAGLSKVPIPLFVLATLLGILPGSFSFVFFGATVAEMDFSSWQLYVAIGLRVIMFVLPIVAVYIRRRRKKQGEEEPSASS